MSDISFTEVECRVVLRGRVTGASRAVAKLVTSAAMAYRRAIFVLRLAQTVELVPKRERSPAVRSLVACQHAAIGIQLIFSKQRLLRLLANKAHTASCGVRMTRK